jgi:hypothetical protein
MPKYFITWNPTGHGGDESKAVVEATDEEEATSIAYDYAKDEFESSAEYSAEEFDPDNEEHEEHDE